MIIIPSRGRPIHLNRLAFHYSTEGGKEPVTVMLDEDDAHNYAQCTRPANWNFVIHGPRAPISEITNKALTMFPNAEYYGVLADDVIPLGKDWDTHLKNVAGRDGVAYCDDGIHGPNLSTHIFMGGDLARAIGWISYPGCKAWCCDNLWLDIGRALGTARYVGWLKLEHMHPNAGKGPMDQTYLDANANHAADVAEYQRFHQSGEFAALIERVKAKLYPNPAHAA